MAIVGLILSLVVDPLKYNSNHPQAILCVAEDVTFNKGDWAFQCNIVRDIVYSFNDISTLEKRTLEQCCEACWSIKDFCVVWTWRNSTCILKDAGDDDDRTRVAGAISGWMGAEWPAIPPTPASEMYEQLKDGTITTLSGTEIEVYLWGSDLDLDSLFKDIKEAKTVITELPEVGELFQNDLTPYRRPGTEVTDKLGRIVFFAPKRLPGGKTEAQTTFRVEGTVTFEKDASRRFAMTVIVVIKKSESMSCKDDKPVVMGEIGRAKLTDKPIDIKLQNKYHNPVIIAQPLSSSGKDVAITRIINVTDRHFTIAVHEPSYLTGDHVAENVFYMILETGSWVLEGGYRIMVTSATVGGSLKGSIASWNTVRFPAAGVFRNSPVVFSQTQSYNDQHWVTIRQSEITEAGFKVALEEEEDNEQTHGGEIIGWVAMDKVTGRWTPKIYFEIGASGSVSSNWTQINFTRSFPGDKHFIAEMQTFKGADAAHLRYRALKDSSVEVKVEEEESKDRETSHVAEVVGYIVLEGQGSLKAIPGDCASTPIAEDRDATATFGEVTKVQLLKKDQYSSTSVRLITVPTKGILYQYESDFEDVKDVMDKAKPILAPATLEDTKGRVLYIPFQNLPTDGSRKLSDSFTFVLAKNNAQSNVAKVDIEIFVGKISPPSSTGSTPTPATEPSMNYKTPFVGLLIACGILAVVIFNLGFFLYKKRYGTSDMIGFFKSRSTGDGGVTYYVSGDEDSLTSPAETHFADEHSSTSDSISP